MKAGGRSITFARCLGRHAALVAPLSRTEWTAAMLSELEHLPAGMSPIRWALEMLLCFLAPTWLFVAIVLSAAQGVMPWRLALLYSSVALIGPLGLLAGIGSIHFRRGALSRTPVTLLALLAAWCLIGYSAQLLQVGAPASEWWRDFVLIALLPALAVAHLAYMASGTKTFQAAMCSAGRRTR
jgi:hypothetical protein